MVLAKTGYIDRVVSNWIDDDFSWDRYRVKSRCLSLDD